MTEHIFLFFCFQTDFKYIEIGRFQDRIAYDTNVNEFFFLDSKDITFCYYLNA